MSGNNKLDIKKFKLERVGFFVSIIFSLISVVFSYCAFQNAEKANKLSETANNIANNSNEISTQSFDFSELEKDIASIQNYYSKFKDKGYESITNEDLKDLENIYNSITQHLDLDSSNKSDSYLEVFQTGTSLKNAVERYISIISSGNIVNNNQESEQKKTPNTGELPDLETLLSKFKSAKRKYYSNK